MYVFYPKPLPRPYPLIVFFVIEVSGFWSLGPPFACADTHLNKDWAGEMRVKRVIEDLTRDLGGTEREWLKECFVV